MAAPQFVLVRSTNPHREGQYGRLGHRFTRAWKALRVDSSVKQVATLFTSQVKSPGAQPEPVADPTSLRDPAEAIAADTISPKTLAAFEKDPHLAVKPATQTEVDDFLASAAENETDKDATIADLKAKNREMESRLMKLELAVGGGDKGKAKPDDKGTTK